ncbi:Lactoylglutathione lyase [Jimgerdemannia flammicorona]|uniref:Lactoylglutathione lyase n=1 Tax=Jimgerdemannia flammicorona TaxID=994334 RepID=A0A433Q3F5_9FUNG|nr:Lactoylglutathione lyase [Jimgerdemannia flammicorona]
MPPSTPPLTTSTFRDLHHIAIIASNYPLSKHFYTHVLGFAVLSEIYRAARDSHKLDLQVSPESNTQIELFSFPSPPPRPSRPEAAGARHVCFAVRSLEKAMDEIRARDDGGAEGTFRPGLVEFEDVRVDELTNERLVFFADPDGLPIELKEVGEAERW